MSRRRAVLGLIAIAWVALGSMAALQRVETYTRKAALHSITTAIPSLERGANRFSGAEACRPCHPGPYGSWYASYHRTMTQTATATAVLGRFDGVLLDPRGHRPWRSEEGFRVDMPGANEVIESRDIVMTTGSHHMQVYWVADIDGTLKSFPYAYLLPEDTWIPNESTLLRPSDSGVVYTWNRVCIKCHAVAGTPGFDPQRGTVASRVVDLGIACESCHGPGRLHVEHHRDPVARYAARLGRGASKIVDPADLDGHASSEICGQCHSITAFHNDDQWVKHGRENHPPDPLAAWATVVRHPMNADQPHLDDVLAQDSEYLVSRFWADGMVRVSGREYNGVIESPCHVSREFGCLSCHSMHRPRDRDDQLRADPTEDEMCLQCHSSAAQWGSTHTHHEPKSSGSRCLNCHMPHTTYGLLKAIRSHQVDSPSVEASLATGRPNACNACHLDRSLTWVARTLAQWYGHELPPLDLDAPAEPAMVRWLLAGDAGQRALAAWHFGWAPALEASGMPADARGWGVPLVAELLTDPYPAVRWVAFRTLRTLQAVPHEAGRTFEHDAAALKAAVLEQWNREHQAVPRAIWGEDREHAVRAWALQRDDAVVQLAE